MTHCPREHPFIHSALDTVASRVSRSRERPLLGERALDIRGGRRGQLDDGQRGQLGIREGDGPLLGRDGGERGEGTQANVEHSGGEAGGDQDAQEHDQRDGEAGRGHADQTLLAHREHHRLRAAIHPGPGAGSVQGTAVARRLLVNGKGQVPGGDHLDDPVEAHLGLGHSSGPALDTTLVTPLSNGTGHLVGVDVQLGRRSVLRLRSHLEVVHILEVGVRRALLRAVVAADLDGALEVDLHRVGELEGLEVGVRQHGGGGAEVLDLGEPGHQLGPGDASPLVHQLNGSPLPVVRHTIPHQHVELGVVVLDGQDHGHRLADLHQARHLGGPRTLAHLDLHPAANVVAGEVRPHHVQHVDGEGPEGHGLLVLVVPRAAQLPGLIPHLLHLGIVLDDDDVLEVGACPGSAGFVAVALAVVVRVSGSAALMESDVEAGRAPAQAGGQVDAVHVAVVALGEDDAVEGLVELDEHLHAVLLALHVQGHDLGHVLHRRRPDLVLAGSAHAQVRHLHLLLPSLDALALHLHLGLALLRRHLELDLRRRQGSLLQLRRRWSLVELGAGRRWRSERLAKAQGDVLVVAWWGLEEGGGFWDQISGSYVTYFAG